MIEVMGKATRRVFAHGWRAPPSGMARTRHDTFLPPRTRWLGGGRYPPPPAQIAWCDQAGPSWLFPPGCNAPTNDYRRAPAYLDDPNINSVRKELPCWDPLSRSGSAGCMVAISIGTAPRLAKSQYDRSCHGGIVVPCLWKPKLDGSDGLSSETSFSQYVVWRPRDFRLR